MNLIKSLRTTLAFSARFLPQLRLYDLTEGKTTAIAGAQCVRRVHSSLMGRALTLLVFSLTLVLTATNAGAQQKRQTAAKTPPRTAAAPTPAPTFESLLATDCYKIYGEVRGIGQLIRSNSVNELLEPIMKIAGPPKEFTTLVKWLNTHADEVMTSRMLVATWPTAKNVPDVLVAIDFASAEEAGKFEPQLNGFLSRVLPPTPPEIPQESLEDPNKSNQADKPKAPAPPKPNYYLKRTGSMLLITSTPLTLKNLRPAASKLLADDVNFRVARNRFNSEPIFLFIDVKGIEKEEEQRRKQYEEAAKAAEAAAANQPEPNREQNENKPAEPEVPEEQAQLVAELPGVPPKNEAPPPDPMSTAFSMLTSGFFSGQPNWPEAVGIAVSFDPDSFDARALLISAPGEKSDVVPFVPLLIPGPPLVPESPSILPADTELFVTASLDLPQIYSNMATPPTVSEVREGKDNVQTVKEIVTESPMATIEKQLKINIKEDLLPLLGSEVVLSLPVKELDLVGPPGPGPAAASTPNTENAQEQKKPGGPSPVIALSLKDREGMRLLLPKIIEAAGFKGASALAQTERREDTELVSFANVFSYAFVGNFLVLSADAATTRHVIDSYLKRETLSGDSKFKNYTRWQPRQLQGQVYISPALMESYKTWAEQPNSRLSEQTREFLTRLSVVAQPITYSLSNEGLGPLHELHVPKNLVLMAIAGLSNETNPPPIVANERMAIGALYMIANAEEQYKTGKGAGSFGTLEQLIAENLVPKNMVEDHGYKLDVAIAGDKFEVTAVPLDYGKSGVLSYFIDKTRVVRAGDHGGGPATVADNPLH